LKSRRPNVIIVIVRRRRGEEEEEEGRRRKRRRRRRKTRQNGFRRIKKTLGRFLRKLALIITKVIISKKILPRGAPRGAFWKQKKVQ